MFRSRNPNRHLIITVDPEHAGHSTHCRLLPTTSLRRHHPLHDPRPPPKPPPTIKTVPTIAFAFAISTAINARTVQPRFIPNLGPTLLIFTLLNTIVQEVGEDYDVDVDGGAEDSETEFGFGGVGTVLEWVVGGCCKLFVGGIGELRI
jgi:hypothetical protein